MSEGWKGPRVQRDRRSPYVKELEEEPETANARRRWQHVVKSQRESRFSDGPVFKKINQPKQTFYQKHFQKITGFFMIGGAFFFFAMPIYGLFVQPLFRSTSVTSQEKLGKENPNDVLERVIAAEYFKEHGMPFLSVYDKEDPTQWRDRK